MTPVSLDLTFNSSEEVADSVRTVSPASNNESSIATLHEVPNETIDGENYNNKLHVVKLLHFLSAEPDSGVTSEMETRLNLTGTSHQNMRRNSRGCRERPSPR